MTGIRGNLLYVAIALLIAIFVLLIDIGSKVTTILDIVTTEHRANYGVE